MAIIESEFLEMTTDLDVEAFWAENELCEPFTPDKPRCAASFSPDDHWIFEFMQVPSTVRYYHDTPYRNSLHQEVNHLTQQYVGKVFFEEDTFTHSPKRIENLFRCDFTYLEGSTPWLTHVTADPLEFAAILDAAEETDMETWSLPEPFVQEWDERRRAGRSLPKLGTGSRGPATIITSVLHPETAIYWMIDHPELMARFAHIMGEKMVELNRCLRTFSGTQEPGWWITDDNCALLSPRLYRKYCVPVLDRVLNALAPGNTRRYQHSDSSMGHLIGDQYGLGIRAVNYGPEVDATLIRAKMPDAIIHGQLPPLLLRNGSADEIRRRIEDDFAKAGATGGMEITTAGSLAAGTGVGRMRWFMQCVQDSCRYDLH